MNKEYNVVIKATDQFSPVVGKVDRRLEDLSKRLKTFGKVSDNTVAKKLSDVEEGLSSPLGFVGKGGAVLGAVGIAGIAGRMLQGSAKQVDEAIVDIKAGKGIKDISADLVRTVPLVGDAVKGLDAMRESLGNLADTINSEFPTLKKLDEFFGFETRTPRDSLQKLADDAAKANAKVDAFYRRRADVAKLIREDGRDNTPEANVISGRDKDLAFLKGMRKRSEIDQWQYEQAVSVIVRQSEDKLTDIRREAAAKREAIAKRERDAVRMVYDDMARDREALAADLMDAAGNSTGATIKRMRDAAKQEIDAIRREIADTQSDPTISDSVRRERTNTLRQKEQSVTFEADIRERMAVGKERESIEDRVAKIRRESVENAIEGGNRAAEIELKKLDIIEKYKRQREEIDRIEKESLLTEEQKAELRSRRESLAEQEQRAIERISRGTTETRVGIGKIAAEDGRFRSGSIAQSRQVETFRDDQRAAKDTAKNTAKLTDASKLMIDRLDKLVERLRVVRLT